MKARIKTWLLTFITLIVFLPGLPYCIMFIGLVLKPFGLSMFLFMPSLIIHNLYFALPALLFGKNLYPAEEFGYLPTKSGYVVAAALYAIIALLLSLPVSAALHNLQARERIESNKRRHETR
jgi:hypothetical protein